MGLFSYSSIRMYYQVFMVFMMFMVLLPQLIVNLQLIETPGFNRNHWISCAVLIYFYIIYIPLANFLQEWSVPTFDNFPLMHQCCQRGNAENYPSQKDKPSKYPPSISVENPDISWPHSVSRCWGTTTSTYFNHTPTYSNYIIKMEKEPHTLIHPVDVAANLQGFLPSLWGIAVDTTQAPGDVRLSRCVAGCPGVSHPWNGLRSFLGNIYGWTELNPPNSWNLGISDVPFIILHPSHGIITWS